MPKSKSKSSKKQPKEKQDFLDKLLSVWWGKVLSGILILAFDAWMFSTFSKLDSGEIESARVNRLLGALYSAGGKWAPTLLLGAIAVAIIVFGIAQLVTKSKDDA